MLLFGVRVEREPRGRRRIRWNGRKSCEKSGLILNTVLQTTTKKKTWIPPDEATRIMAPSASSGTLKKYKKKGSERSFKILPPRLRVHVI